jgi:hypothetical protein
VYAANQFTGQAPVRRGSIAPVANYARLQPMPMNANPIYARQLQRTTPGPAQPNQIAPPQFQYTLAANENRHSALSRLGSIQSTLAPPPPQPIRLTAQQAAFIINLERKRDLAKAQLHQALPQHVKSQWMLEYLRLNEEVENFRRRSVPIYNSPVHTGRMHYPAGGPSVQRAIPSSHFTTQQQQQQQQQQQDAQRAVQPNYSNNTNAFPFAAGFPMMAQPMSAAQFQQQQQTHQPYLGQGEAQHGLRTVSNAHNAGQSVMQDPSTAMSPAQPPQSALLGSASSQRADASSQVSPEMYRSSVPLPITYSEHTRTHSQTVTEAAESQGAVSSTGAEANLSIRSNPSVIEDSGFDAPSPGSNNGSAKKDMLARASRFRKVSEGATAAAADAADLLGKHESPSSSDVKGKGKERERLNSDPATKRLLRSSPAAEKVVAAELSAVASAIAPDRSGKPINKKRIEIALRKGDLVLEAEWEQNSPHLRKFSYIFTSHDFGRLYYYWSMQEQATNRRLVLFQSELDGDTGRLSIATTVIPQSEYPRVATLCTQLGGVVISLHFKDGVDRAGAPAEGAERQLYWVTNYDVLKLVEYLVGLHVRTCHHIGNKTPREMCENSFLRDCLLKLVDSLAARLKGFGKCITVGKLSKNEHDKAFAKQLFACAGMQILGCL